MLFSLSISPAGAYLFTPLGGGSSPAPLWTADFVNGAYTVGGLPVALGTMFTQDTDWSTFNPATDINGNGLVGSPVLTGAALSAILLGATYVFHVKDNIDGAGSFGVAIHFMNLPDYSSDTFCALASSTNAGLSSLSDNFATETDFPQLPTGVSKVALTMLTHGLAVSVNGGSVYTLNYAPKADLNALAFSFSTSGSLTDIAAYQAQPDADLPALSAA